MGSYQFFSLYHHFSRVRLFDYLFIFRFSVMIVNFQKKKIFSECRGFEVEKVEWSEFFQKMKLLHIFFPVLVLYINVNLLCMKYYCVAMQHALYNYSHQQCFWKRKISRLYGFFLHEKKVISVKASDG